MAAETGLIYHLPSSLTSPPLSRDTAVLPPFRSCFSYGCSIIWRRPETALTPDTLAVSAQGFRRGANRVRKQMWWVDNPRPPS